MTDRFTASTITDGQLDALYARAEQAEAERDGACGPATFALWLDASDGSIAAHDGVRWPDGTTTIHHRYHRGLTSTHSSPEAAALAAYGKQGRIVWNAAT